MQLKTFVTTAALLLALFHGITCAPLTHEILQGQGSKYAGYSEDAARIDKAVTDAHSRIDAMHTAIHNPTVPAHAKAIEKAFGKTPDMEALKTHVDALRNGHIQISNARSGNLDPNALAATNTDSKHIRMGAAFHDKLTDQQRAETVIHEASHAISGTKDVWEKDPKTKQWSAPDLVVGRPEGAILGYHRESSGLHLPGQHPNKQFKQLRAENSPQMHMNADSWATFSHKLEKYQGSSGAGSSTAPGTLARTNSDSGSN
jgi:hypothetical protein